MQICRLLKCNLSLSDLRIAQHQTYVQLVLIKTSIYTQYGNKLINYSYSFLKLLILLIKNTQSKISICVCQELEESFVRRLTQRIKNSKIKRIMN
ncbi:unnamed protein product [Paramecium sonneborni]|uniref:Uncharacterized protein n=1 Tax=Paramecium sonneborni TaxID=65129 RepID=A0A8S1N4N9_9CILI|nr:unnamed protein product [Paramecium sonneborni]